MKIPDGEAIFTILQDSPHYWKNIMKMFRRTERIEEMLCLIGEEMEQRQCEQEESDIISFQLGYQAGYQAALAEIRKKEEVA